MAFHLFECKESSLAQSNAMITQADCVEQAEPSGENQKWRQ